MVFFNIDLSNIPSAKALHNKGAGNAANYNSAGAMNSLPFRKNNLNSENINSKESYNINQDENSIQTNTGLHTNNYISNGNTKMKGLHNENENIFSKNIKDKLGKSLSDTNLIKTYGKSPI